MENQQLTELMDRVVAASRPNIVFSAPVERGEHTLITASEVVSAGGFGSGSGSAPVPSENGSSHGDAGGSGGGGGGFSSARPVAAIVIGPDGVHVRPVVDVTKIALAAITAWGAMAVTLSRMRK
jgi:uncharacterized spore protein YtfJ